MSWKNGIGIHRWNLRLRTFFRMLYWVNIHNIMYGPTIFCIKTAITLQYISIFVPRRSMDKFMFYGGWTAIFANLVFYLVRTIVNCIYCIPREKIWNKLLPGGHCIRNDWFITSTGLINAISDIVILLLPITSLWKLKIARKKKVQISMLSATGVL
ncbi:hypothetical protein K469DRAFT_789617 [Zopfia rhizophila CBS 207.26]|uniref:Rhodopsin domain-containing protein n=1 Tax=Zopfia rhizophila CBS 207.26 TaxID=1314779 RepID=A0A6A6EU87_9PEZI|nr:hypothetical protein K469DRAFT_789617 [Zopfia rhizophila CBS 207.26]